MTRTLKDIDLPLLYERYLFYQLSNFYEIANGLVPAIPHEDHLELLGDKRIIKHTQYTGYACKTPNVKRSQNNSKCYNYID